MRKISKTLVVVGLLTPLSAGALGIGEIKLKSALNQNLSAEVPLVLSGDESIADLRINLASPEAFRRAGIDLQHFLHGLNFEVVPKADGQFAINISSRDAIREPFLNFLVEVSWPKGRMQREFTLLLDPPTTFKKGVAVRTAPRVAPTLAAQPAQPAAADYGPVASGETLWSITRKLSASGAPSRRLMQEIFENNPDAFHQGNINALRQGVTLKLPGELAAAPPAGVKPSAKPEKELTLATPKQEAAGKGKPGLATKGEIALEVADTVRQENEDIRNRLAEMEKQIDTMQRLLTLKDQQIAALQSAQAGVQPAVPPAPAVAPPPEAAAPPPVAPPPVEPKPAEIPPVVPLPEALAPAEVGKPPAEAVPPVAPAPPPVTPAQPAPPAPAPKPVAPPPAPVEEPGFLEENFVALVAGSLALFLGGVIVAVIRRRRAALLEIEEEEHAPPTQLTSADNRPDKGRVSGLITPSQQGSFLSEFTPSDFDVLDSDNEAIDPLSEADVYLAYGRYQQAEELIKQAINENPFRDECKLKLLEVYYSAQNRQAFEQYAGELANEGKNADREFWARVTAMGGTLCPDSALFGGARAAPAAKPAPAPAQEAEPVASPSPTPAAETAKTDELEISLDLPEKASSSALTGAARIDSTVSLDVDMSAPFAVEEVAPSAAEEEAKGNEIEFDLSALGGEDLAAKPGASGKSEEAAEHAPLDFDLSSFEVSSLGEPKAEMQPEIPPAAAGALSLAADERFAASETALSPSGQASAPEEPAIDFSALASAPGPTETLSSSGGDLDFRVEFEASATETADVGDLTDMDEVETKLDLARAYVDMDDQQSARRLLEEIVAEGNARQQEEAKTLLGRLA